MHVTRTINYGWHNVSRKYRIKCDTCGKTLTRTISDGYNDMADAHYRAEVVRKLDADAGRRAQHETDTCAACLKAKLAKAPSDIVKIPDAICDQIATAYAEYERLLRSLRERYTGLVCRHREAEWEITYVDFDDGRGIQLSMRRISKTRPWQTTDDDAWESAASVEITPEIFADREKAWKRPK
jgi:hypothetical protein